MTYKMHMAYSTWFMIPFIIYLQWQEFAFAWLCRLTLLCVKLTVQYIEKS